MGFRPRRLDSRGNAACRPATLSRLAAKSQSESHNYPALLKRLEDVAANDWLALFREGMAK